MSLKRRTWNDRRPNWYCPEPFAENRPEILRTLIQRYPLATLVSMGGNGLEANRIPFDRAHAAAGAKFCSDLQGCGCTPTDVTEWLIEQVVGNSNFG
ncbi:FMN-binding negative transcriptional regulator [Acidithiobacillus ferridurans]|uniref:FMN-binding negative transcriptional regulator n=1 Tax=Acidithiobacillus ferridurans TaxID=1232575 RepID=UPI0029CA7AF8|nr:FMN-binding negative transcriptional regulator [Acidithiobacillus ferridurans]